MRCLTARCALSILPYHTQLYSPSKAKELNPDTTKCDAMTSDFPDLDIETVRTSEPTPRPSAIFRQKLTSKERDNAAIKPPTPLSVSTASCVSSLAENSSKLPHPVPHNPQANGNSHLPCTIIHGKMEAVPPHPPSRHSPHHHISNHPPGPSSHCALAITRATTETAKPATFFPLSSLCSRCGSSRTTSQGVMVVMV